MGKKLTQAMFNDHCRVMDIVRNKCKNLSKYSSWTKIEAGVDEGAFKIVNGVVHIAINGTDGFAEIISNANARTDGYIHKGFYKNGNKIFFKLIGLLPERLSTYSSFVLHGHSRGGALVQVIAKIIKDFTFFSKDRITVITSGTPPLLSKKLLKIWNKATPFTHLMVVTEKDFTPKLQGPKSKIGKWFFGLFGLERLEHYYTEKTVLPNVRGKIDHLSYKEASDLHNWEE